MSYSTNKFEKAITEIVGDGSLRLKLLNSYLINLMYLDPADLPADIRNDFIRFKKDMANVKTGQEILDIEASVNKMDDQNIILMVEKLFKMYRTLEQANQKLNEVA